MGELATYTFRNNQATFSIKSGFLFNCCGAGEIGSLFTYKFTEKERQDFVAALCLICLSHTTYYFIAADYQLPGKPNASSFLELLIELGAKEIDVRPNRNHGPNSMHLFAWDGVLRTTAWEKYLYLSSAIPPDYKNNLPGRPAYYLPLYFKDLSEQQQMEVWKLWSDRTAERKKAAVKAEKERRITRLYEIQNELGNLIYNRKHPVWIANPTSADTQLAQTEEYLWNFIRSNIT